MPDRLVHRRALRSLVAVAALCAGPIVALAGDDDVPWAFQPVSRPPVPAVDPDSQTPGRNPVDAFLDHDRAMEGLSAATEADRRTLLRRLTYDLTGLPPSIAETEAFLNDERPAAYERLVDRLLASPRLGERWGRHWLDLVRYAESHGYERDGAKPNAWKYRDYVIHSVNADKPYDRFLTEQLAGDEMPEANAETRTATGMHRLGLIDDEPADPIQDRFDQLDDMVRTVGTTFLGVTIHCARCHDHKFDPISQADYYRLISFFEPSKPYVRDNDASISLVLAGSAEQQRVADLNAAVNRQVAALRKRIEAVPATEKVERERLSKQATGLDAARPTGLPMALGLTDAGPEAKPTRLLVRGDAHAPGDEVQPGYLWTIDRQKPPISPGASGSTTGRRLALARWITGAENMLTPRVIVNRLWYYHFGRGIVGTPSDFGAMGEEPTHPELLDWLAQRMIEGQWSLKSMHRLIVTSAAYRRAGTWDSTAAELDPANTLLWRYSPHRLEAEPIRDASLLVSGDLNQKSGGPSVMPPIAREVLAGQSRPGNGWTPSPPVEAARRSVYVFVKRTLPLPELEVLDAADPSEPCPQRSVTTTAPQALAMINGEFMNEQAAHLAARLSRSFPDSRDDQIRLAFQLAFSRSPSAGELHAADTFMTQHARLIAERPAEAADGPSPDVQALQAFCLSILNSNEFVTID